MKYPHSLSRKILASVCALSLTYLSRCLFLKVRQRHLIYRPQAELTLLPSASDFNLRYTDVWIP